MGQIFPYVLPLRERQTVVLAWHPDHIVGPARSTNVKPIFGIAPPRFILSFFMRGGAPESAWGIVGKTEGTLRLIEAKNKQSKNVHWAEDYEI